MNRSKLLFNAGSEKGAATLMIVTILTLVFVSLSIAMTRTNLVNFKSVEMLRNSRKSYFLAESGLEDTLIQVEEDIDYSGNPLGEATPIGTYYSDVTNLGNVYTVTAYSESADTKRIVSVNVELAFSIAAVTTKATYMADTFSMRGEGSKIRGDVWTNDDFLVEEDSVVEGNLSAAGKGSQAVNWVWDAVIGGDPTLTGGRVIDNPETEERTEGNIVAFDEVKVSGPNSYVEGNITSNENIDVIYGATVDGVISEYAETEWQDIPVPNFDFGTYKQQAIENGTYFSNHTQFLSYLNSFDDGNQIVVPDGLYYVATGVVRIDVTSPVYLNGMLMAEDNIYIECEWHQDAINNLPALVSGKDVNIIDGSTPGGNVRINGLVYADKIVRLYREGAGVDIIVDGAVWAGDDIFIEEHTLVIYDIGVQNVIGFDFVTGVTDIGKNYWREVI